MVFFGFPGGRLAELFVQEEAFKATLLSILCTRVPSTKFQWKWSISLREFFGAIFSGKTCIWLWYNMISDITPMTYQWKDVFFVSSRSWKISIYITCLARLQLWKGAEKESEKWVYVQAWKLGISLDPGVRFLKSHGFLLVHPVNRGMWEADCKGKKVCVRDIWDCGRSTHLMIMFHLMW